MPWTRRHLLAGLGRGTAAFLGRSLLDVPAARAADVPKRLLIVLLPDSNIRDQWAPTGGLDVTKQQGDARSFTLGPAAAPLDAVRSHLTLVHGLISTAGFDNHTASMIRILTGGGAAQTSPKVAVRPSIDQLLLRDSPLLRGTPFPSLQIMCDTRSDRNDVHHRIMSYAPGTASASKALPPENQPHLLYARLFAGLAPPGTDSAAIERARAREASVLDFVKGDLARLRQRVGAADRERLESHLQGVRELEGQLDRSVTQSAPTVTLPSGMQMLEPNVSKNHPRVIESHLELVRTAFALDLARVVTFGFATVNSYVAMGDFLPGYSTTGVHALTHQGVTATQREHLVKTTRWYCDLVAKLVAALSARREADGSTMLDNTLVVLFSDEGEYHDEREIPIALFGGARLGFTGGRVLRAPGRWVNDLWPQVATAFGVEMPVFGDSTYNTKAIPLLG